jgi:hypothetical protein
MDKAVKYSRKATYNASTPQQLSLYYTLRDIYLMCSIQRGGTMRATARLIAYTAIFCVGSSVANAACEGSNGRGWGSARGSGKFQMSAADKVCNISFPSFINDAEKTRVPATDVQFTTRPKSGSVSVAAGRGIVYTPNPGFKGRDRFCTVNTTPKVKGKKLAGCITVTVK